MKKAKTPPFSKLKTGELSKKYNPEKETEAKPKSKIKPLSSDTPVFVPLGNILTPRQYQARVDYTVTTLLNILPEKMAHGGRPNQSGKDQSGKTRGGPSSGSSGPRGGRGRGGPSSGPSDQQ